MSTSKHIDKICLVFVALMLVVTILFMNGQSLGLAVMEKTYAYQEKLFDTSYVHTIDIVMDGWEDFIKTASSEEYAPCTVVVDGEKYTNIALRAKGNTSLSNVESMDSDRYSFKLEFDHYESQKSLDGLDKLCLNNLIQDNTMMKDYLIYQLMYDFGVDAPLCSFAYLTVNGEDWGLYLAVEGIEDAFLERNYGNESGELYKPDSMSFGGGRGNGKNFNMDDFDFDGEGDNADTENPNGEANARQMPDENTSGDTQQYRNTRPDFMPDNQGNENSAGEQVTGEQTGEGEMPTGDFTPGEMPTGDFTPGEMPSGGFSFGEMPSDFDTENLPSDFDTENLPEDFDFSKIAQGFGGNMGGGMGNGMGSDDVKLKYIDDSADSYSNIFDNAKTDVSAKDESRLINSLKNLSSYTDLENTLFIDEVLRYFVVHNFSVNGDSYTGSMIHNYYLYESDGKLGMIPWDYNLAFGTFQGNNASSSVNASADGLVSGSDVDDRPMFGWIFSDENYTEQYHTLYEEFLAKWFTDGEMEQLIADTAALISPYVEKDPTKFCTYEEFEAGVTALTSFVTLRAEAINKQLNGDDTLVDAGELNLNDMGTMSTGGGGNMGGGMDKPNGMRNKEQNGEQPNQGSEETASGEQPDQSKEETAIGDVNDVTTDEATALNEDLSVPTSEPTSQQTQPGGNNQMPPSGFEMPSGEMPEDFSKPDGDPPGGFGGNNGSPPQGFGAGTSSETV